MKFSVDLHHLVSVPGFWYLASPYSKYLPDKDAAWKEICRIRGCLVIEGVCAYSPIAETHQVSIECGIGTDHKTWATDNETKMAAAYGCIVVKMQGWDDSEGVLSEIAWFRANNKPVIFLDPQ